MIKIAALNDENDDESESEEEVTREALEEIALQQYARTLEIQKKGNLKGALKLLKDLLDTELLYDIQKPQEKSDNVSRPLLNLKYLCYRNIATLSTKLNDNDGAIEAYLNASELDDSDVTLWFRLGKISLECKKFELASFAFQKGVDCNSKHWPCIDNLITLLLGLGNYNDCISNIYTALKLDPDYYRGRAYRKHIFTDFPYILDYLQMINPIYKWTADDDKDVCGEEYDKLIKEAYSINETYIEQINSERVVERLPILKLNKPVEKLTWLSLGESLTDMHNYITNNGLSHACVVEISQPEVKLTEISIQVEKMEVDLVEPNNEPEPVVESIVEEKIEEKLDDVKDVDEKEQPNEPEINQDAKNDANTKNDGKEAKNEGKDLKNDKKSSSRRRGSSLSFLEQWEWCTKRRSSRKKPIRQERLDENIFESLKRLLPPNLLSEEISQKKSKSISEDSMDTMDIYKLFEEKEKKTPEDPVGDIDYFGSAAESTDVENFITKYVNSTCDIITMIDDYVLTLSGFWKMCWPDKLGEIYVTANNCSKQHIDPPVGCSDAERINDFILINLLHLEIKIGILLRRTDDQKEAIDIETLDVLKFICLKYDKPGNELLDVVMRYLWIKCHSHLYENKTEFAIDCLYRMLYELDALGEIGENYSLCIPNFVNKTKVSRSVTEELLKSLERNKQLSTVMQLYEMGKYEEALPILQDSFKHCQVQASKHEWSEMGLDWAVHLVLILEILWAVENNEQCFTWAVMCLHEAVKQILPCTPGTLDHDKWSLVVIKILKTIEHILKHEGISYLDILPEKGLAHLVQDLHQIITHQMDDAYEDDMPIETAVPWILLHYILQREEDCGRSPKKNVDEDAAERENIPPSLMILFTGHNFLGKKGWCNIEDGALLFFALNTVIPRLRSPALNNSVETVSQNLEQVVFCLFGHPSKKTRNRYLTDHNASSQELDWSYAQQIFELYRPYEMPEFNSYRYGSISSEVEQLFQKILKLMPAGSDPAPFVSDVINYIENKREQLPDPGFIFPYKIRDIYYLLADYHFKNNETIKALKFYAIDIVISSNRFDSWAGIALARASLLETKLNSCETFKTEMDYLNRAAAVERCFKQALEIDSSHSILWIEYGAFVYGVHSFCSRLLKQASESLSMENFEVLEKRKDDMLNTAHKCFVSAHKEWLNEYESDDKGLQDERWLHYYMLGKISEKRGELPSVYLQHYIKAGQHLLENNAMYPLRINYNNPQNLSVEALEIHYRIHASILKYIVHHEDKKILMSVGKVFKDCLSKCAQGPFSKKKQLKEASNDKNQTTETATIEPETDKCSKSTENPEQAAKPAESDEPPPKKPKLSEDNVDELQCNVLSNNSFDQKELVAGDMMETAGEVVIGLSKDSNEASINIENIQNTDSTQLSTETQPKADNPEKEKPVIQEVPAVNGDKATTSDTRRISQESTTTGTSKESSSESSSDSSSDDSSSDSSSSTSDSNAVKTDAEKDTEMTYDDLNEIVSLCLENLEECVSRFPQHYKALYRLAHYYFYYKKDKNIERCKNLMMGSFTGRNNSKMQGLFTERKNSNFFNGIWRIPASEVDRPGSFASHMSRCVLITMEILKEVDDYKILLDLTIQLQRTPEAEKKYLRDAERSELSQQAYSLCTRSVKALFSKFNTSLNSMDDAEKKSLQLFTLDVYKSYQKIQKHMPAKSQSFSTHLIDCFKVLSGGFYKDSTNLLDYSIKHCQSLMSMMKQQQNQQNVSVSSSASTSTSNTAPVTQNKKQVKVVEPTKPVIPTTAVSSFLPTLDLKQSFAKSIYAQSLPSSYMSYDPLLSYMGSLTSRESINNYDMFQQLFSTNLVNSYLQQIQNSTFQNSALSKLKLDKKSNVPYKRQMSTPTTSVSMPKTKSTPKNTYLPTLTSMQMSAVSKKLTDSIKYTMAAMPNLSTSIYNVTPKSAHQLASNSVKPAHQSPSNSGVKQSYQSTTTSNVKPAHQSPSNSSIKQYQSTSSSIVKPAHQSPSNSTIKQYQSASSSIVKPAHQSPSNSNVKPAHQPIAKPAHQSTSTSNVKPAYQSTSSSNLAKPAHMIMTNTVNAALHTKPPLPHQQVSPGKTLQEKLAERQKQIPNIPKIIPESVRSIDSAAFAAKIPASLTITRAHKPADNQMSTSEYLQKLCETKKSQPKPKEMPSEVIVLDDD